MSKLLLFIHEPERKRTSRVVTADANNLPKQYFHYLACFIDCVKSFIIILFVCFRSVYVGLPSIDLPKNGRLACFSVMFACESLMLQRHVTYCYKRSYT